MCVQGRRGLTKTANQEMRSTRYYKHSKMFTSNLSIEHTFVQLNSRKWEPSKKKAFNSALCTSVGKTLIGGRNNKTEKRLSNRVKQQVMDLKDIITWGDIINFGLKLGRSSLGMGNVSEPGEDGET